MGEDCARLKSPFTISPYLASGATGLVFAVSDRIVVKTVWRFENPTGLSCSEQQADSFEGMRKESEIYDILRRSGNWHPNIVPCFLNTPFYLFLERQQETLFNHISEKILTSRTEQYRWMHQISAAATWLERLQLTHGDLRPINILLDHHSNVKLCDFDGAYHFGEYIVGGHEPYYKMDGQGSFGQARLGAEQYAIGGCFYFILTGEDPDFLGGTGDEYTGGAIDSFPVFNHLMRKCWNMEYGSIADLKTDIVSKVEEVEHLELGKDGEVIEMDEFESRVKECKDYLARCRPSLLDFNGDT